mgnify:CR=1 FL=1|tara:strand:+ start:2453 stop:3253 length:801 start_codon:yes stop_codon:yes gene_type:complete
MKDNIDAISSIEIPKGYRAYNLKGVKHTIIARKGGPTADQIKTRPTYQKLRNNQKEFAVASMMSKTLRESLTGNMNEICETYVSGRLTAQFRNLVKKEEGPTGKRPLYISKHGQSLNGFEFNTTYTYDEIFKEQYYIKTGSRWGQVILHFPAFIPDESFKKPKGATNFKVKARLVGVSDYKYDDFEETYLPLNKDIHGRFSTYETPMLPLLKIPTSPMTTQICIDHDGNCQHAAFFLIMAISFYTYENGKFIHLPKESAMSIKKVF